MARPGVHPRRDGGYDVSLPPLERELLAQLAAELEALVAEDATAVPRLFPPAYKDDAKAEQGYRDLVGSSLVDQRRGTLRLLQGTAAAERLSQAEADAWCTALNDLRLVLGERIGMTEELAARDLDPFHPDAREHAIYAWLTWLQASVVDALAERLER